MSTVETAVNSESRTESHSASDQAAFSEELIYRSISKAALASAIFAIIGGLSFFAIPILVFSLLAVVLGILGSRTISKFPEEFQGGVLAVAGIVLGAIVLVGAPSYHAYVYLTEVPEGYERLNFGVLMSGKKAKDYPPPAAFQYNGKKVFVKGYIHPTSIAGARAKKFVLVPDMGTCCFGGQPPLTNMIEVKLKGKQYASPTLRKQRLAGTLRVSADLKAVSGLEGVYYELSADILK